MAGNKISDFTLDLKSKRRGKGQKIIQQRSSKRKHKESKAELTQRIQKQLKDFAKHNPEIKPKNKFLSIYFSIICNIEWYKICHSCKKSC